MKKNVIAAPVGHARLRRRELLIAAVLSATPGVAGTTGRIAGTVRDSSGSPVAQVKVEATSGKTGAKTTVTTNKNGAYGFLTLMPGVYSLATEAAGFKPLNKPGIVVHVDSVIQMDLVIEPDAPAAK
jgi:Carboxypeptidase regulatory-like domain